MLAFRTPLSSAPIIAGVPGDALMAAALACTDAADFRRRIRE